MEVHNYTNLSGLNYPNIIDPGDAGNRRGIDLFRLKHPRMICQHIIKHIIRLAAKNCTQIPQISLKLCIYVCAWQHNIPRILHAWILTWYFFSGWATAVFLCFSSVQMLPLSVCKILYAKCMYIIQTSQIIIVRKCKSLKMALILTYVQKFGQGYWCNKMSRSCTSSRLTVSTMCLQNLGHKQLTMVA